MSAVRGCGKSTLSLGALLALVLVSVPAAAQRILNPEPYVDPYSDETASPERRPAASATEASTPARVAAPVFAFIQPIQTAIYAGVSLSGGKTTEIAIPVGLGFQANSTADYLVELTAVNVRGAGPLSSGFTLAPRGISGNFSRTSLYGSIGYQMYSGTRRTGLLFTPKFYAAVIQESQTAPAEDHVGVQLGGGFDLGMSLQYERVCVQLVGGLSLGLTGGAVHEQLLSPLVAFDDAFTSRTRDTGLVIDLNANLLRVGFVF